jgi:lipopolysaccharide transport system ATP-binding protein
VAFDVMQGERVGIIGRNGAGKSTLLKILSRITYPTKGKVTLRGRVASLLEVGTGFHPELTGRENIYMNGATLGMHRAEIKAKFDEIVAFAEVAKFLDTPVKRYSSGMYVRLAFAVAAHLDPEILLVDEVLAVGDAQFQKKCLGKMEEVSKSSARTVLFVSHNMTAIRTLCERAVLLESGTVRADGPSAQTIAEYLAQGVTGVRTREWQHTTAPGDARTRLVMASVESAGPDPDTLDIASPLDFRFRVVQTQLSDELVNVNLTLYAEDETMVFVSVSSPAPLTPGIWDLTCRVPAHLLNDGSYTVRVMLVKDAAHPTANIPDVLRFSLAEHQRTIPWLGRWPGAVRPNLEWRCESVGGRGNSLDAV